MITAEIITFQGTMASQLQGPAPGRTLVCSVDDSEDSEAAVAFVLKNLARPGDVVKLLTIVPAQQVGTGAGARVQGSEASAATSPAPKLATHPGGSTRAAPC